VPETDQPKSDEDPAPLKHSDAERVNGEEAEDGGRDAPAGEDDDD
jgi:hypothetical protein